MLDDKTENSTEDERFSDHWLLDGGALDTPQNLGDMKLAKADVPPKNLPNLFVESVKVAERSQKHKLAAFFAYLSEQGDGDHKNVLKSLL